MSDRPPMMMVRRGSFLAPLAPMDSDALSALPIGKALKVRVTQARSLPQSRLYFSLCDLVAANLDQDVTGDDLHEWLKIRLGLVTPIRLKNGTIAEVAKSVAFDKMEQPEFQAYCDKALDMMVEHIIPGTRKADLMREARAMLGEAA